MKELTVLLGAGFSYQAGMPLVNDINKYFDRDLREKLLVQSSSEWSWIDIKNEAFINNGRLNYDFPAYSYIMEEAKNDYKKEVGKFRK